MKVLDPGHRYELASLDGEHRQVLQFVKRCDPKNPGRYPGNQNAYPGTTMQNVIRALLERMRYVQRQQWCVENVVGIVALRVALWLLEFRAARRHGRFYWRSLRFAETAEMCPSCGHTDCWFDDCFYVEVMK